jgi:hypothetical protein
VVGRIGVGRIDPVGILRLKMGSVLPDRELEPVGMLTAPLPSPPDETPSRKTPDADCGGPHKNTRQEFV